ncbi:hypothetical protein GCK32_019207, partial [Trichostrongylus colubriformis]
MNNGLVNFGQMNNGLVNYLSTFLTFIYQSNPSFNLEQPSFLCWIDPSFLFSIVRLEGSKRGVSWSSNVHVIGFSDEAFVFV